MAGDRPGRRSLYAIMAPHTRKGDGIDVPVPTSRRALTLALALAVDAGWGEPPRAIHPVVWQGKLIATLIRRAPAAGPRGQMLAGAAVVAATVGASWLAGRAIDRAPLPGPVRLAARVWLLKSAFAGQALLAAAGLVGRQLTAGDLVAARSSLTALVSRPTAALDEALVAAAAIESVGENAADSFVAPLFYHVLGGLPLALAYRAVNTLDAMIGYRGEYEYLGKVAARLDDLANLVPARLTAALIALAAWPDGRFGEARRIGRRDAGRTASPNAGRPMATLAGALGVELEKVGHYRLGDATRPVTGERLDRALVLIRRTLALAAGGAVIAGWVRDAA